MSVIVQQGTVRVVRSPQGQPAVVRQQVTLPRVVRTGVPGSVGPPGTPPLPALVAAEPLGAGTPLYVSRATGQARQARSDAYLASFVLGLAEVTTQAGFAVRPVQGAVTRSTWTAITGTATLLTGQPYFLAPTGGLTTTAPTRPAAAALCRVGLALSPTTLDVRPSAPVLL